MRYWHIGAWVVMCAAVLAVSLWIAQADGEAQPQVKASTGEHSTRLPTEVHRPRSSEQGARPYRPTAAPPRSTPARRVASAPEPMPREEVLRRAEVRLSSMESRLEELGESEAADRLAHARAKLSEQELP